MVSTENKICTKYCHYVRSNKIDHYVLCLKNKRKISLTIKKQN